MIFNPLEHPVCLEYPLWLEETAWAEHIPFAMFLISALRPQVLVELGAYRGVSYCAFCQASKSLKLKTKSYAVDTWRGDKHAGELDDHVLTRLRAHHDPLYADFSTLLQATFDDALPYFSDNSIDLLHIDGYHTYEAVSHDFETWLPKMSASGVVLFHDTNVRRDNFGVWKFWEEQSAKYPNFEFLSGHGLGVLAIGAEIPAGLKFLFEADETETKLFREFFHGLGSRIDAVHQFQSQQEYIRTLQTYEEVVLKSRLLRAFRILKDEGVGSLLKKSKPKGERK
jgi:hypothetical protein